MPDERLRQPFHARKLYRLLSAVLGLVLIGTGVYALLVAGTRTLLRISGGVVLVVLGFDLVWSAWTARESWLSKIGPLP